MAELLEAHKNEPTTSVAEPNAALPVAEKLRRVTGRAIFLGLLGTALIAWLNCWLATKSNVHMIGGIQMPFGALAVLMILALFNRLFKIFSPAELLTMYSTMVIGALISTPGCDNAFMAFGPTLFYFNKPENGWARLFWKHVPTWFAPGWNGTTYQKQVVDPFFLGGVQWDKIPWQAWTPMFIGWGIFMLLIYALMFFTALLLRKQWTQREALAFPLVEVPVQMADAEGARAQSNPSAASFWSNRMMWIGLGLAFFIHSFNGLHALYPDWPIFPVNIFGSVPFTLNEAPWNAIPTFRANVYLGGIGLAYLLTREVSFSFWFFYFVMFACFVFAQLIGYPVATLDKIGISPQPAFIMHSVTGGWLMMAALLIWTAREYLGKLARAAFRFSRTSADQQFEDEPFSPRFMVFGWLLSLFALLGWSWFAGINVLVALVFFGIFIVTSLVISRVVIEGGFLFPQPPFYALQAMTNGFGMSIGASDLTRLGFVQPAILVDMRTSVLPAFLHTMKIAEILRLDRKQLRRLLFAVCAALVLTAVITTLTTLQVLYSQGGLQGYTWFSFAAGQSTFQSLSATIKTPPHFSAQSWIWMAVGALLVYAIVVARARLLWFPLHPLGFLMAPGYPISQLWFSFFLGWLIKTLIMKYGGNSSYVGLRPFMIGLILGNAAAMLFWTLLAFNINGTPIPYWPA